MKAVYLVRVRGEVVYFSRHVRGGSGYLRLELWRKAFSVINGQRCRSYFQQFFPLAVAL